MAGRRNRIETDIICHCKSAEEARALWGALADRFAACKLVLHPQKTKIVYCKDANRRGGQITLAGADQPSATRRNESGLSKDRDSLDNLLEKEDDAQVVPPSDDDLNLKA